jgi:hypothetical protein
MGKFDCHQAAEGSGGCLGPENEPETVDWGPDVGSERFYDNE